MATTTTTRPDNGKRSLLEVLKNIAIPLSIICAGAVIEGRIEIAKLQVRLTTIESNRFTDRSAHELERRINTEMDRRFAQYPPQWLTDQVKAMESRVHALDLRKD